MNSPMLGRLAGERLRPRHRPSDEIFARRHTMALHPATASAAPQVTGAIRQARQSTGISFEYLLTTAKIESNFNPSAQCSA
jgi:hypothetical protein